MPRIPHNIEKLQGKDHWTGYGAGIVWHITRSNSSFGTWAARPAPDTPQHIAQRAPILHAFRLADMGAQLEALPIIKEGQ